METEETVVGIWILLYTDELIEEAAEERTEEIELLAAEILGNIEEELTVETFFIELALNAMDVVLEPNDGPADIKLETLDAGAETDDFVIIDPEELKETETVELIELEVDIAEDFIEIFAADAEDLTEPNEAETEDLAELTAADMELLIELALTTALLVFVAKLELKEVFLA